VRQHDLQGNGISAPCDEMNIEGLGLRNFTNWDKTENPQEGIHYEFQAYADPLDLLNQLVKRQVALDLLPVIRRLVSKEMM
jgi:hypothetical protein